jgi:hypothetical protein
MHWRNLTVDRGEGEESQSYYILTTKKVTKSISYGGDIV